MPDEINFNPETAVFDMVATGKVECGGAEYKPGEDFKVTGISTVRWLQGQGAAEPKSSAATNTQGAPDDATLEAAPAAAEEPAAAATGRRAR